VIRIPDEVNTLPLIRRPTTSQSSALHRATFRPYTTQSNSNLLPTVGQVHPLSNQNSPDDRKKGVTLGGDLEDMEDVEDMEVDNTKMDKFLEASNEFDSVIELAAILELDNINQLNPDDVNLAAIEYMLRLIEDHENAKQSIISFKKHINRKYIMAKNAKILQKIRVLNYRLS
jgi:hypothetical protein